MKKKLEAELISIAHRILKLKNKSDIVQLHQETQKLYEKLSVLRFAEEHLSDAQPTIGSKITMQQVESALEASETISEPSQELPAARVNQNPDQPETGKPLEEKPKQEEPKSPPPAEEVKEPEAPAEERLMEDRGIVAQAEEIVLQKEPEQIIAEAEESAAAETKAPEVKPAAEENFKPAFEWAFETKTPTADTPKETEKPAAGQFAFDDLLGKGYVDPVFVKPEDLAKEKSEPAQIKPLEPILITRNEDKIPVYKMNNAEIADKTVSLNDRLSRGITVGLNDRIAFVKHLFGNSSEDYNRVLSQLITLTSFEDAQEFIENMVKPDYNNWEGKEEYAQRFMEVVEKKFA